MESLTKPFSEKKATQNFLLIWKYYSRREQRLRPHQVRVQRRGCSGPSLARRTYRHVLALPAHDLRARLRLAQLCPHLLQVLTFQSSLRWPLAAQLQGHGRVPEDFLSIQVSSLLSGWFFNPDGGKIIFAVRIVIESKVVTYSISTD